MIPGQSSLPALGAAGNSHPPPSQYHSNGPRGKYDADDSARTVPPPSGNIGNWQSGQDWTLQTWKASVVDFDKITELAPTPAGSLLKLARPSDAARSATLCGRPAPRPGADALWYADACRYCLYRAPAPAGSPEAKLDHPNNYLYGVGSGAHNPRSCQAFKRWLAEGGGATVSADLRPHIQMCLIAELPAGKGGGKGKGGGR